jgi:Zn-dependent protease
MTSHALLLATRIDFTDEKFVWKVATFVILILSLSFHEYGHAWSARRCGDATAEELGRLTLNPLPHLHPLFTILLPIYFIFFAGGAMSGVFFAAARPVPVDVRRLRRPVLDMTLVSVAGPAMNVLLALFFTGAYWFHTEVRDVQWDALSSLIVMQGIQLNLALAIFNMLPIPPLDGHRVVGFFLPERLRNAFYSMGQFGFLVLILLIARGQLDPVLRRVYAAVDQVWKHLMPDGVTIFGIGV